MKFLLVGVVVVAVIFIWWRFFYIARPAVPPLFISDDDQLMREAVANAKQTIPGFRQFAARPNRAMRVKVPFVSSSGTTEFLWAEVLSLGDSQMELRYLTPPVTHTGRLE